VFHRNTSRHHKRLHKHPRHENGWHSVTITLPDWQDAGDPLEITLDETPTEVLPAPCADTMMIEFSAPDAKPSPPTIAKKRKSRQKSKIIYFGGKAVKIHANLAA
jgi:hypothetical protein